MAFKTKEERLQYHRDYNAIHYKHNGEAERKRSATYYENNKDRKFQYRLWFRYRLTLAEYNNLLINQKHVCKICNQPESKKDRTGNVASLSIDHDHKTKQIRGLLCRNCNAGLGYFKDMPDLLNKAMNYLAKGDK